MKISHDAIHWWRTRKRKKRKKKPQTNEAGFIHVNAVRFRLIWERDSSVVKALDSRLKGRRFESLQKRRENFLLQGQLSVLTLIRYPFHPRVTAVARKRPRSFCQKCEWQVTAKYACTLRMWLCIKWHGAWLYGVHRTCAETAAVSCGTCQCCKYTTSVDIQKGATKS